MRGDFYGKADFDVLIVVKKKNYDILRKVIDVFYEEEKTEIPYSVTVKDEETFEKEKKFKTGFYFNILYDRRVMYGKINP